MVSVERMRLLLLNARSPRAHTPALSNNKPPTTKLAHAPVTKGVVLATAGASLLAHALRG